MNKHTNKKRLVLVDEVINEGAFIAVRDEVVRSQGSLGKKPDPNTRLVETDHMPAEVATGLLCETKCTNPQRKVFMDARANHYTSIREAKSAEERTRDRLRRATWMQLVKWNRRAIDRENAVQHLIRIMSRAMSRLEGKQDTASVVRREVLVRSLRAYMMKGDALQKGIEALGAEIDRRLTFVKAVEQVAPSVAEGMCTAMARGE